MTALVENTFKRKIDLYHLIQKQCNRPAYFWYGFRYIVIDSVPDGNGVYTIEEMIDQGRGDLVLDGVMSGLLDPEQWCLNN